jgi:hypothetical protein
MSIYNHKKCLDHKIYKMHTFFHFTLTYLYELHVKLKGKCALGTFLYCFGD